MAQYVVSGYRRQEDNTATRTFEFEASCRQEAIDKYRTMYPGFTPDLVCRLGARHAVPVKREPK